MLGELSGPTPVAPRKRAAAAVPPVPAKRASAGIVAAPAPKLVLGTPAKAPAPAPAPSIARRVGFAPQAAPSAPPPSASFGRRPMLRTGMPATATAPASGSFSQGRIGPPLPPVQVPPTGQVPCPNNPGKFYTPGVQYLVDPCAGKPAATTPPAGLVACPNDPTKFYDPNAQYLVDPCGSAVKPPAAPPVTDEEWEAPEPGEGYQGRRNRVAMMQQRRLQRQIGGAGVNLPAPVVPPAPPVYAPPIIINPTADPTQAGGPFDPNRIGPIGPGPVVVPEVLPPAIDYSPAGQMQSTTGYDGGGSDILPSEPAPPVEMETAPIPPQMPSESGAPWSVIEQSELATNVAPPDGETAFPEYPTLSGIFDQASSGWWTLVNGGISRVNETADHLVQIGRDRIEETQNKVAEMLLLWKDWNDKKAQGQRELAFAEVQKNLLISKGRRADAAQIDAAAKRLRDSLSDSAPAAAMNKVALAICDLNKRYGHYISLPNPGLCELGEPMTAATVILIVAALAVVMTAVVAAIYILAKKNKEITLYRDGLAAVERKVLTPDEFLKSQDIFSKSGLGAPGPAGVTMTQWIVGGTVAVGLIILFARSQRRD